MKAANHSTLRKYDLVIFDWDGTLMDSIGKIIICIENMARALALPVPSETDIRNVIGLSMTQALQECYSLVDYCLHRRDYQRLLRWIYPLVHLLLYALVLKRVTSRCAPNLRRSICTLIPRQHLYLWFTQIKVNKYQV